jgi:hypothetical protein
MEETNTNDNQVINLSYEELEFILNKIASPNPNKEDIMNTNDAIRKYSRNILSVEGFLLQIKNNPNIKIRQLAAVLLKRKLEDHWNKMEANAQTTLKDFMLQLFINERNYLVLKAIANLIFKIAKQSLINNQWTDLHEFIFADPQKYSQDQAHLFELNLYIISELIESSSYHLKSKLALIKSILEVSINMGSQKMKEYSTKCLGNLVRNLEKEELNSFKDVIPIMFKEIKNFSEDTVFHVYEVLCEFHINSLEIFENYLDHIIQLTIWFLNNNEYSGNTKLVLSEFLMMLSEYKKKIFIKDNYLLLRSVIEVGFKLLATNNEVEDDTDDGQLSDYSIGSRIIEYLSKVITSKHVFPIFTTYIQKLLTSNDAYERRAAITSFGLIAEGCNMKVSEMLEDIVNTLVNSFLNDPAVIVKSASIISMDKLTQHCPEVCEHHAKVIPMLIQGLSAKEEEVVENSLIELNYFCRSLDLELEDYVGELLPRLIFLLENHKSVKVQENCLFALASVIGNAQGLINQTLFPILDTCRSIIMNRKSEEEEELRANALDCVAQIAFVIKMDLFSPYKDFFTAYAVECVKSNKYILQDAGFTYFNTLSGIMGESFADYLADLMTIAFEILQDDSGITECKEKDEFGFDSDSEDEDDKIGNVYINEDFVDAKCSAILAISQFAKSCPKQFLGYVEKVFVQFEELWNHVHDNVNIELIMAYENLLVALHDAEGTLNGEENTTTVERIYKKAWASHVFPKFEKVVEDSDIKEEVSKVLECIYHIIDHLGKNLFVNNNTLERLMNIAKTLLDYQAACQIKNNDEDEDDEEADYDEQILGKTVDIFLILSEKIGNEFHEYFAKVYPSLKKYLGSKRTEQDRSSAFGCFADVLKHCTVSTKFYLPTLFTAAEENVKKNLKKKDEELFRHIAYLLGIFFQSDPVASKDYLIPSLTLLQTIFENSTKTAKDNVIAALCNLSMSLGLTFESELFSKMVETVMTNIPLKHDSLENPTVLKFICYLTDKLDMKGYEIYFENILVTVKFLVLNEIKCGTSKQTLKDIKAYLEILNQNEVLRNAIEKFISSLNDSEKERFVNTIRNA